MSRNTDFIPFALPLLSREEEEAVLRVMRSGWLTTGNETRAFEEEFAAKVGAKHAIALNSATAGLHLALEALALPKGSRVITTPYTFTSTAEIIRYLDAHPLFVDIDEATLNISPEKIERALKASPAAGDIKGIIPVHLGGLPCRMEEICTTARKNDLFVVEDAAHSFPSRYKDRFAGTWGDLGIYSFYATKTITTGEGGMAVTENDKAAETIRCLRLHGIDREVWNRYQSRKLAPWEYDVIAPGYKYNPTDMGSAIGRIQLKKAENFLKVRQAIAEDYFKELSGEPGLIMPARGEGHSWHLFILRFNPEIIKISRNHFIEKMAEEGIGSSVHYKPLHLMSYYSKKYGLKPEDFPVSTRAFKYCLSLPIYPGNGRRTDTTCCLGCEKNGGVREEQLMPHDENLFIDDISRDNMVKIIPVTSNIPRGRIKNLILPDLPEGYGIIGPEDIPGNTAMDVMGDPLPFFAGEEIAFEGQTIRLLYGPDEEIVRQLCRKVRVEYETDFSLLTFRGYDTTQILKEKKIARGKPGKQIGKHQYITSEFKTSLGQPRQNELYGGFAVPEGEGLLIRGASQWPFFVRDTVARGLDILPQKITFQGTAGLHGSESPIWYPALLIFYAALTAKITGKAARIIVPHENSILNCPDRAPAGFKLTSIVGKEGKVIEREILIEIDAGSIPLLSSELLDRLCLSVMGAYPQGTVRITARLIQTSTPPLDNFIGLGMVQGFFVAELHESKLAVILGEDPLERKKNWCQKQGTPFTTGGNFSKKVAPDDLLEKTGAMADFKRKHAAYQLRSGSPAGSFPINPRRGIGISLAYQGNGLLSIPPGRYSVSVKLDADEQVSIRTSSVPAFPRTREIWKETAARLLQVLPKQVHIDPLDTALVPDSGPALFSNNVTIIPRLIEQCCQSILKKRFRDPLPIEIKRSFRQPSQRSWDRDTFKGGAVHLLSWASAAVEIELDPVGQKPELRGIWMTIDCGRIMNLSYARSVIESSIHRGFADLIQGRVRNQQPGRFPEQPRGFSSRAPLPLTIDFIESAEPHPGGMEVWQIIQSPPLF